MQPPPAVSTAWTLPQKILCSFFFCFILLWTLPFPLGTIPFFGKLEQIAPGFANAYWSFVKIFWAPFGLVADWVGANIFHVKGPVIKGSTGCGDTTWLYLLHFSRTSIALVTTIAWSIFDRKRKSYNTLYYWTGVLTRYYLAVMMFYYGFDKVFHLQMRSQSLEELTMLFGDKSPAGLAWSFMGYSKAFSFYVGLGEVIGGLLLLWRRSASLGALVVMIVMSTVTMMNYTFDICVKINSSVFFLFAFILLLPDCRRLMNVLVWNKPTEPAVYPPMIRQPWQQKTKLVLKYVFIIGILADTINYSVEGQQNFGDKRTLPPLYGIYNTEYIVRNNDTIPLLLHDTTLWKQIVIDLPGSATFKTMNDSTRRYNFKIDTLASTVLLHPYHDTLDKSLLNYKFTSPYLDLRGIYKGDTLALRLKRYDENNFLLVRQKFRWISERPVFR